MELIEITYIHLVITFVGSLVTGVLSGFGGAYVAIKVMGKEIEWINKTLDKHEKNIDILHGRFSDHVADFHTTKSES